MNSDKNLTQEQYNQVVLDYGQQFYFHILKHKPLLSYQGDRSLAPGSASIYFPQIFPHFEQAAQEFFNPKDPEHKLLDFYFNVLMQNRDIGNILTIIERDFNKERQQKSIADFLKHLIDISKLETRAFSTMPFYQKTMLQKDIPATSNITKITKESSISGSQRVNKI